MSEEYKLEIRDLRDGDWYWVPKAVIRKYVPRVGATGIVVYDFLASLVDGEQKCFPSQKYIADSVGYSRATVNKSLKKLERARLVKVIRSTGERSTYYLLKVGCKAEEIHVSNRGNQPVKHGNTNNNKLTINNNNTTVVAEQTSPLNGSLINRLIAGFREVNPNYERLFANNTQRLALERLLRKFGAEKVEKLISLLPQIFGRPYAPRITTPLKLEEKLADLLSFLKEEKEKGGGVFTTKSKQ